MYIGAVVPLRVLCGPITEDAFVSFYKNLVRYHLEYANSMWNRHRLRQIKDLEKVQMSTTKLVMTVKHLSSIDLND